MKYVLVRRQHYYWDGVRWGQLIIDRCIPKKYSPVEIVSAYRDMVAKHGDVEMRRWREYL